MNQVFGGLFVFAKVQPELGARHHEVCVDGVLRTYILNQGVEPFAGGLESLNVSGL